MSINDGVSQKSACMLSKLYLNKQKACFKRVSKLDKTPCAPYILHQQQQQVNAARFILLPTQTFQWKLHTGLLIFVSKPRTESTQ